MKTLLIETDYGNGFIVLGELSETIKIIDSIKPIRIFDGKIIIDEKKKMKYSIVFFDQEGAN